MPLYKHDCMNPRCCKYIGSTNCSDVYLYGTHSSFDDRKGVIIRTGDDGASYHSWPSQDMFTQSGAARWVSEAKLIHDWMYSGC